MDITTYIPEAGTLIDGIHEIKQWVYEGSIKLLIPICTLEQVEKAYKASTAPKEVQKDTGTTRPSGRASRKEQPLFDINPRATWEFLSRAKSEKGERGVKLQTETEEFTQWKEEDERAAEQEKAALTPTAPTTFAEALLRKLNMKDGSESDTPKAPPKPRLVARANEPKSPWKYHKVPTISSKGIPSALKPLYSCVLWHVYEQEKNPLVPEKFMLLVKTKDMQFAAEKLGIPSMITLDLKTILRSEEIKDDHRVEYGELEAIFPEALAFVNNTIDIRQSDGEEHPVTNGHGVANVEEGFQTVPERERDLSLDENGSPSQAAHHPVEAVELKSATDIVTNGVLEVKESAPKIQVQSPEEHLQESTNQGPATPFPEAKTKPLSTQQKNDQVNGENSLPSPVHLSRPAFVEDVKPKDSDSDSDEEVVVFNPRARRASGRRQRDAPRSRPATSSGPAPKILKSASKDATIRPTTSGEQATLKAKEDTPAPQSPASVAAKTMILPLEATSSAVDKLKPKIESTLKPESPVFTPGKPFVVTQPQPSKTDPTGSSPEITKNSPPKSPALLVNGRNGPPRQPRAIMQQRQASQEQLRLQRENQQRESERMIQRQREAIQRRARAIEKPVKKAEEKVEEKIAPVEKPPPRQIQLVPTDNPTVIDPDAFDRSYVVQAPASSPSTANTSSTEKRRSNGHRHRGSGSKRNQASPKRGKEVSEPEVEFVLKSGAPRGSVRGKGKLWIP